MTISIDFDGTIYEAVDWPNIGKLLPGAREVINEFFNRGYTIIINTLREGDYAEYAKKALELDGIHYHYFNENTKEGIDKYYDSRKIGADVYIDDRCVYAQVNGINWLLIKRCVALINTKNNDKRTVF